ncbi:hypothetical protein [Spiroplasma taiwanense]|uniref:Uncharacterized protein n=1 Tax=Spiroplasma taiwanense CT-1 TaxID=1276220 RepID=S5LTW5_9MOLU|nr:hypothetical protein [Spiroplasma taiwanense]AGR41159.1 hypothetical protein STAIW_v1c05320 [Spiroplasma taiwanense CT-1]
MTKWHGDYLEKINTYLIDKKFNLNDNVAKKLSKSIMLAKIQITGFQINFDSLNYVYPLNDFYVYISFAINNEEENIYQKESKFFNSVLNNAILGITEFQKVFGIKALDYKNSQSGGTFKNSILNMSGTSTYFQNSVDNLWNKFEAMEEGSDDSQNLNNSLSLNDTTTTSFSKYKDKILNTGKQRDFIFQINDSGNSSGTYENVIKPQNNSDYKYDFIQDNKMNSILSIKKKMAYMLQAKIIHMKIRTCL